MILKSISRLPYACAVFLVIGQLNTASAAQMDLFPTDRITKIQITLDEEDWNTIRRQSRNFLEALGEKRRHGPLESPFTYVKADVIIDGKPFPSVGVRKKGFIGSLSTTRPSLKIKLNFTDKSGAIGKTTHLTLNNNKQDPSLLSQYLSYATFRKANLPSPKCSFAHVTVNGKDLGIYSHVESIRKPFIKLAFGSSKGTLYEGTIVDFHSGWEQSLELKFGDDEKGRAMIQQLTQLMNTPDPNKNNDLEQLIGNIVDLDAFYKFWAMEGLLGFWDGYSGNGNNYYIYLNPKTDRFHFIPWGTDSLFVEKGKFDYLPNTPLSVKTMGLLSNHLYRLESGKKKYHNNMEQLLAHVWNEGSLLDEIERVSQQIEPLLHKEQGKFKRGAQATRDFIETRRSKILAEISDGMPAWDHPPRDPLIIGGDAMGRMKGKPNSKSITGAAREGNLEAIRAFVKKGGSLEERDAFDTTPLAGAAISNQKEAVKLLLELGAKPDSRGGDGSTPIHGALFFGLEDIVKILVSKGADVNAKNLRNESPLDIVTIEWNDELSEMIEFIAGIIQIEVDLDAIQHARPRMAAYLRANDAKHGKDLTDTKHRSLWMAAKEGDLDALEAQAKGETDINAHDAKGITPLAWASMSGQPKAVSWLLKHGADVNATNKDGATALHGAAFFGRTEAAQLLIKQGADVKKKNLLGLTALASIDTPWNEESKGIVQWISKMLELEVDLSSMQENRKEVVKLLKK